MTMHKPETYDLVMNENKNLLSTLPDVKRFQLMVVLSAIWATIFCLGMGSWLWWGGMIVGHVGVAVGILITGLTFTKAGSQCEFHLSNAEFGLPENHPQRSTAGGG